MLNLDTAARAIGAGRRGPNASFDGVTTDSRQVAHGDLFVALKGDRFDGHAYVDQALEQGAAGALVADVEHVHRRNAPLILVDDTRLALGKLAAHWRTRLQIRRRQRAPQTRYQKAPHAAGSPPASTTRRRHHDPAYR